MTNVLGIIGEYNPFHNGHKYHLEQSKQMDEVVIYTDGACSGNPGPRRMGSCSYV